MSSKGYFDCIREFGRLARKELGQNFLIDDGLASKMVDALSVKRGEQVVEIGPGAGSLSYFLALTEGKIELLEIDKRLYQKLVDDFGNLSNMHVRLEDASTHDYKGVDKVIGNLPYYLTSELLERFLLSADVCQKAVFMAQKEAQERLFSRSGKDYAPLNVLLSYLYEGKKLMNVSPTSFLPPPHVSSTVFVLNRKENVDFQEGQRLYHLARGLFAYRRKTLQNNLTSYLGNAEVASRVLAKTGIDGIRRAESLSLREIETILSTLQ